MIGQLPTVYEAGVRHTDQPPRPNILADRRVMRYLKHNNVRLKSYETWFQVPVTPTTKSPLPISRNFSIVFKPDNIGIWLSKKMT
jgi:hypothetical protein